MTVFVLTHEYYSNSEAVGVFSSLEQACKSCFELIGQPDYHGGFSISEFDMDSDKYQPVETRYINKEQDLLDLQTRLGL